MSFSCLTRESIQIIAWIPAFAGMTYVSNFINMLLSIVTLNYKTPQLTLACIASVYAQFRRECDNNMIEHIIVDNSSGDNSVAEIKKEIKEKKYTHVKLIENPENAGFGKGCNLGTEKAAGTFVLFLNSDTKVANRGFLEMTEFLSSHLTVAIMGGKMKNANGSAQLSAAKFYTLFYAVLVLLGLERLGFLKNSPNKISKVDWVSGGCMMVRKSLFEKIGGFDKNIFMYMEDMELCFRAKKHGFTTYFYPFIEVFHVSQGSSNRTFAIVHIYEGFLYFYRKYMPQWQLFLIQWLLRTKAKVLLAIGKVTGNTYLYTTYEKALAVF